MLFTQVEFSSYPRNTPTNRYEMTDANSKIFIVQKDLCPVDLCENNRAGVLEMFCQLLIIIFTQAAPASSIGNDHLHLPPNHDAWPKHNHTYVYTR